MDELLQKLWDLLAKVPPLNDQTSQAINIFVFFVQWIGIILYALAGLYDARKNGMDFYGCLAISLIVSVGGGTVRDLLLGRFPIFWISNPSYVITIILVCILGVLLVRAGRQEKTASKLSIPFLIIDSLGLGLWAYLGTFYALQMGVHPLVAPVMGIVTASFGGVLRDVFFNKTPQMFMPGQPYVLAAAFGLVIYTTLWWLGVNETASFLVCIAVTFIVRVLAVKFNIRTRSL